jgi:hypothetical protein
MAASCIRLAGCLDINGAVSSSISQYPVLVIVSCCSPLLTANRITAVLATLVATGGYGRLVFT